MSEIIWAAAGWLFCGCFSLFVTADLEGNRWGKVFLFALGPIGMFLVMVAAARD